ncbi:MAG: hypothetical protein AB8G14_10745 [Ilumatobacter sp.]
MRTARTRTLAALAAGMMLAATACSSDVSDTATPDDDQVAVTEAEVEAEAEIGAEIDTESEAEIDGEAPDPTEPPTTEQPVSVAPPLVPNLAVIEQLTELAQAGEQPLLAWSAVEGADSYRLVVRDGAGDAYWAWSGTETEVFLGGGASRDGAGARVPDGGEWSIIARDTDGATIATSGWTPLT